MKPTNMKANLPRDGEVYAKPLSDLDWFPVPGWESGKVGLATHAVERNAWPHYAATLIVEQTSSRLPMKRYPIELLTDKLKASFVLRDTKPWMTKPWVFLVNWWVAHERMEVAGYLSTAWLLRARTDLDDAGRLCIRVWRNSCRPDLKAEIGRLSSTLYRCYGGDMQLQIAAKKHGPEKLARIVPSAEHFNLQLIPRVVRDRIALLQLIVSTRQRVFKHNDELKAPTSARTVPQQQRRLDWVTELVNECSKQPDLYRLFALVDPEAMIHDRLSACTILTMAKRAGCYEPKLRDRHGPQPFLYDWVLVETLLLRARLRTCLLGQVQSLLAGFRAYKVVEAKLDPRDTSCSSSQAWASGWEIQCDWLDAPPSMISRSACVIRSGICCMNPVTAPEELLVFETAQVLRRQMQLPCIGMEADHGPSPAELLEEVLSYDSEQQWDKRMLGLSNAAMKMLDELHHVMSPKVAQLRGQSFTSVFKRHFRLLPPCIKRLWQKLNKKDKPQHLRYPERSVFFIFAIAMGATTDEVYTLIAPPTRASYQRQYAGQPDCVQQEMKGVKSQIKAVAQHSYGQTCASLCSDGMCPFAMQGGKTTSNPNNQKRLPHEAISLCRQQSLAMLATTKESKARLSAQHVWPRALPNSPAQLFTSLLEGLTKAEADACSLSSQSLLSTPSSLGSSSTSSSTSSGSNSSSFPSTPSSSSSSAS